MILAKIAGARKSFTIWFNGVMAVVIPSMPYLKQSFPDIQPFLQPSMYQWIGGIIIAANILLRFKTNSSLADK